jgi:quercetin dioxygenase-like cupin family protein
VVNIQRVDDPEPVLIPVTVAPPPCIEPFEPTVTRKVWGDEILVAQTAEYTGKILKRYGFAPFHRAGLQYHPDRAETAHLVSGRAWLYWVDADGVLRKRLLIAGATVHIPLGAIHSFETVGNSVVFETSTPGTMPAVNVEAEWDISEAVES